MSTISDDEKVVGPTVYVKEQKAELARGRVTVQRLKDEEALLLQDIAAEQGRWTDLNQRLEQLERELARRR